MSSDRATSRSTSERRRRARCSVALAWVLALAGPAAAQPVIDFVQPRTFPIGGLPYDLLVADLDGDGPLDLLTTNFDAATISVLLGTGDGDFVPLEDQFASAAPSQVAAGDFDADGRLDLVISEGEGDWVNILLGNGDGTFAPPRRAACSHDPAGVVTADMNGDGALDVVVSIAAEGSGRVDVLLGNGDGSFRYDAEAYGRRLSAPSYGIGVGDLNGDGAPDVAAVTSDDSQLSILLGDGTGALARPVSQATGALPARLALFDLDGAGPLPIDILTADSDSDQLSVFRGAGDGTFANVGSAGTGAGPVSLSVVDADRDQWPDAIVANTASGDISVVPGRAGGLFGAARHFAAPLRTSAARGGDFNGDGRLDLVGASTASFGGELVVMLGRSDGFEAVESLLPDAGVRAVSSGDLTGDGLADLLVATTAEDAIAVLPARDTGGFDAARPVATGLAAALTRSADLDGDGRLDVLVADAEQPDLHVLMARADGGFAAPLRAELPGPARALVVADLDRDQRPDVAATGRSGLSVGVLFGDGDGTFTGGPVLALEGEAAGLAVGDFDADGHPDLAAGNLRASHVAVFRGAGGRTFQPAQPIETGLGPFALASGDLDGDGFDDLAALASGARQVRLLFGGAGGTFTPAQGPTAGGFDLALRDVSGDLRPDLLIADQIGNSVAVAANQGGRRFAPPQPYVVGLRPTVLASGDFDGDGRYDVVAHGNGVWVMTNLAGAPDARGDGNGDGRRSAADLVALARARWRGEPHPVETAARRAGAGAGIDTNGDGQVDGLDPLVLGARIFGG